MTGLTSMRNIGKEMARKLTLVGITSSEELRRRGSKEAFFLLKKRWPQVCLVHLYALEGAVSDMGYHQLSQETKKDLKAFSDFLKNGTL